MSFPVDAVILNLVKTCNIRIIYDQGVLNSPELRVAVEIIRSGDDDLTINQEHFVVHAVRVAISSHRDTRRLEFIHRRANITA